MRALLVMLLLAASVAAQAKPDTPEQAADKVLAAVAAKDEAKLKALAKRDQPDPWLVADELCFRGKHDAAEAFAKAAPRVDTEKLPAYVASRRDRQPDRDRRKSIVAANRALLADDGRAALAALERVETSNADVISVRVLFGRGIALRSLRQWEKSTQALREAAQLAERIGWAKRAGSALGQGGISARSGPDSREALDLFGRQLALERSRGDRNRVARALGNIGLVHVDLGEYEKSLEYMRKALEALEALGDQVGIAYGRSNIGHVHKLRGEYSAALEQLTRALESFRKLNDRPNVARVLGSMGGLCSARGDHVKALEYYRRALGKYGELKDSFGIAWMLNGLGITHKDLGDYRKGLDFSERALGLSEKLNDTGGAVAPRMNIGNVYAALGDYAAALEHYGYALKLAESAGDHANAIRLIGNIGDVHRQVGDHGKALQLLRRSQRAAQALGDQSAVTHSLMQIGLVHEDLGAWAEALDCLERARAAFDGRGDTDSAAVCLVNMGVVHQRSGNLDRARDAYRTALASGRERGDRAVVFHCLFHLAIVRLSIGQVESARADAREAVGVMARMASGLAAEESGSLRGKFSLLFQVGLAASKGPARAADASFFLESGRAAELTESLGGRRELLAATIPHALQLLEIEAREKERTALARYRRALDGGEEVEELWKEVNAAREEIVAVARRIQRDAKAQAGLIYPAAAPLEEIQATLQPADALLLFGSLGEDAALTDQEGLVLVVRHRDARLVSLGAPGKVIKASEALARAAGQPLDRGMRVPPHETAPYLAKRLKKLVIDPLGLDSKVKRLLISPTGRLCYLPFALLTDREVVYVPSGTTYKLLVDTELKKRGKKVLALGDPDYETKRDETALTILNRGDGLRPLPGSGKEAQAIGDLVLLGKKASVTGLRDALGKSARWRAVHFACHGLIDPERPVLSSLALSADGEDDGFLRCLDVFRMKIPADLVVLSACETAKGKVYKAEGVVGWTRAFMMAGAPRVIVSLWKVDDEATRALMVKFYELWKPGKMETATALKKAQEYVASHEKWKHPYYWAAWQLWGLGD